MEDQELLSRPKFKEIMEMGAFQGSDLRLDYQLIRHLLRHLFCQHHQFLFLRELQHLRPQASRHQFLQLRRYLLHLQWHLHLLDKAHVVDTLSGVCFAGRIAKENRYREKL